MFILNISETLYFIQIRKEIVSARECLKSFYMRSTCRVKEKQKNFLNPYGWRSRSKELNSSYFNQSVQPHVTEVLHNEIILDGYGCMILFFKVHT